MFTSVGSVVPEKVALTKASRPESDLVRCCWELHSTVLLVSEATVLSASRKLEDRAISGPAPYLLSCTFPAAQLAELPSNGYPSHAESFLRAGLPSNLSEFDAQLARFSFYRTAHQSA